MPSNTISPSIDQGAKQNFLDRFFKLAQQTKSKLVSNKAIMFMPSDGKTNNLARIGRIELTQVDARNPDKQYGDYALDNRHFTKNRFTKTIVIDEKYDINELITDPSSDIMAQLVAAKERVIDRVAVAAAVGPVLTGASDVAATSTSAATDGVLTVDGTAGFSYEVVETLMQNAINADLDQSLIDEATICITGKENTNLMNDDKFISYFYGGASRPVEKGVLDRATTFNVVRFAGSVNGGVQVLSPVLPELTSTRQCVWLAPDAIAMAMEIGRMDIERSATKVNSWDLTIDLWINAMRTEGVRVQIITTTL